LPADEALQAQAVQNLNRIAFLLERNNAATYRVQAFRSAASAIGLIDEAELESRIRTGSLTELPSVGPKTSSVVADVANGTSPAYLVDLEATDEPDPGEGAHLLSQQIGDCHSHTDWSDGGSPLDVMARTASDMGKQWLAVTDHSPRLKIANGLTAERLQAQLELVEPLARELLPFRLFSGIEVDILEDGQLDQTPEMLNQLGVVVASVHNKLRMEAQLMTPRMVRAVADPATDVLGHCTGRQVTGRGRPPSSFDADLVFAACNRFDVAVEINCRPDRLDPPMALLRKAAAQGCLFSIDTDAHAPGQLAWQAYGCARAAEAGISADRVVTTWDADALYAWTRRRGKR
jgi:putative hydrolase